jgi:hypothetical protein
MSLENQLQQILNIKNDIADSIAQQGLNVTGDFSTYATKIKQIQGGSGSSFNLFDTKLVDHKLQGDEALGWALQGSSVYKTDYPDFYDKCLEEYQNSSTEQVYSKSNIVVVGELTDNNGLLSGFSNANYVTLPNHFLTAAANANTWEAEFRFTTGSSITSPERQIIFHSGVSSSTSGANGVSIDIYSSQMRITYYTSGNDDIKAIIDISTNQEYFIKVVFDYTASIFSIYSKLSESDDWTLIQSATAKARLTASSKWNQTEMGCCSEAQTGYYFAGSINLNNCYINIDGKRWWSGVQHLEYKKNSNGHLFYDISTKDQIDQIFASTGSAWMYGVDQENERILLPRNNFFEQATGNISEVALSVEAGLPNITGKANFGTGGASARQSIVRHGSGAFRSQTNCTYAPSLGNVLSDVYENLVFDASLSNPIYGNSDTVQPNAVKKLLYICVGNTVQGEAIIDISKEIELNNPFCLGDSKYSAVELNNISWLKSEGQWNNGNVYTTFYNDFVNKLGQDFGNGKIVNHTEIFTDYDLVINQDEMSFRLPLLSGSENLPSGRYDNLTLNDSGSTYTAPANGWFYISKGCEAGQYIKVFLLDENENLILCQQLVAQDHNFLPISTMISKDQKWQIHYTCSGNVHEFRFIHAQGNGSLYYYVGETVQNANLINAGKIQTQLIDKLETDLTNLPQEGKSYLSGIGMPSTRSIDFALGATGTQYTAPANGWFYWNGSFSSSSGTLRLSCVHAIISTSVTGGSVYNSPNRAFLPVSKGEIVTLDYANVNKTFAFKFIYAQGEQ